MSPKIYITSDHHFAHKRILDFEKEHRPFNTIEEHDEELIDRWNSKVNKKDTVWHLGDFCFNEKALEIAGRLNGIKKLVLGNHDLLATHKYLKYFNKVYGAVSYKGYLLTHAPIHPSQKYRFKGNIHGHLHSKVVRRETELAGVDEPDPFYINVSIEQHDLSPAAFNELILLIK